jgi:hypothetical protein
MGIIIFYGSGNIGTGYRAVALCGARRATCGVSTRVGSRPRGGVDNKAEGGVDIEGRESRLERG